MSAKIFAWKMDMKKNSWVSFNCVGKNREKKFLELSGFNNPQDFILTDKPIYEAGLLSIGIYLHL